MHIASKMISWAVVHACALLNVLSSPDSTRSALANGTSSGSAYLMVKHDISRFLCPLFSYGVDKAKAEPKDAEPTAELVMYLGLAPAVNAWVVAPLSNINKTRITNQLRVNPDPSQRPVDMDIHDLLSSKNSLIPSDEDTFRDSCRSLLEKSSDNSYPKAALRFGIVVFEIV